MPMTSAEVAKELSKITQIEANFELRASELLEKFEKVLKAFIDCNGQGADIVTAIALHDAAKGAHATELADQKKDILKAVDDELAALGQGTGGAVMADPADIAALPA